ncbi:MAG TPA: PmoA family protein [Pirellulales bacterium]|jgi:hypothetical protein|nr:PmoA family protein [Pirellulales bacterium]
MPRLRWSCLFVAALSISSVARSAEFSVEKTDRGVTVNLDGKLFTEYLIKSGAKPILWPIIGPTGAEMTRNYPMKDVEGERKDHFHHRSLWFTHMEVNGVNFWAEAQTFNAKQQDKAKNLGETVHREFRKVEASGDRAIIETANDWVGPDGKKVLEDVRTITLRTDGDSRLIDFDIDLIASEGPVLFGDNKDGVFGVRVPTTMDVDSKLGGQIVNSNGQTDKDAWGKRADWCDYHGPVEGQTVGIAILDHPTSFRHPTPWHVRTYGLFAANAFGLHDFDPAAEDGSYTLPKGEKLPFRYRVVLHKGDEKQADIAGAYAKYAK